MNKKSAIELSVNSIVILILAIVILSLVLWFVKGLFWKTSAQFEEQISKEPEPTQADVNTPITLSRESIITHAGSAEIIKAHIFNPTGTDWTFREPVDISDIYCNNDNDGICFIDITKTDCDEKTKDDDCKPEYNCKQNSEIGEGIGCVIVIGGDKTFWITQGLCSPTDTDCDCGIDGFLVGYDPDCDPTEGVRLKIECSQGLNLETLTNPKQIKSSSSEKFTAILNIDKKTQKGNYLCKIGVEGFVPDSEKYIKELTIVIN